MNRLTEGFVLGDRYVLGARIASGGMADVWAGADQVLQRAVAVKVMRPDTGHEELFAKRFRDEAVHSAALLHTNIATLFDYGEDDGLAFLVMELVKGEPLSLLLRRRGALPAPEVRSLLGQAALALGVAHEARVVHRDVKPANILVRPDGLVKLTDFGIARALDAAGHTRAGEMLGTPHYISPEQAMGEAATGASDLYALGVVAHEMLSGRRPFDRGTPVATALSHVTEPPPPLPDGVPEDLAELVTDCLSKDPAARPENAREVARRVGIGEHEMAGLALGLAIALDGWSDDSPDTDSDGSVLRFPDLGGPTMAIEA
jgi:serine/threonine-protein kinase